MKYSFYCPTGFYLPPVEVLNDLSLKGLGVTLSVPGIHPQTGQQVFTEFNVSDKRTGNLADLKNIHCDHLFKRILELQKLLLQLAQGGKLASILVKQGHNPFRKSIGQSGIGSGTPRQEVVAMNLVQKALAYFIAKYLLEYSKRCM